MPTKLLPFLRNVLVSEQRRVRQALAKSLQPGDKQRQVVQPRDIQLAQPDRPPNLSVRIRTVRQHGQHDERQHGPQHRPPM